MTTQEVQDFIHIYSILSFRDGRKEPGILVNKYDAETLRVAYFFIHQVKMHAYKEACENYDREATARLLHPIDLQELVSIRPVSLSDYKMLMQLLGERNRRYNG